LKPSAPRPRRRDRSLALVACCVVIGAGCAPRVADVRFDPKAATLLSAGPTHEWLHDLDGSGQTDFREVDRDGDGIIDVFQCDTVGDGGARDAASKRIEFTSYQDLEPLMEELGYTPETWQAGIREVPRLYLTKIPPRWRDRVSNEVSVLVKKRIFFRTLAPLVLHANELILEDRKRLAAVMDRLQAGGEPAEEERAWLGRLAVRYEVAQDDAAPLDPAHLEELRSRVDVIPVSLALGQAAEESGWGTSRFAAQGNALFGQWTWGGKGMKPAEQRESLGDHRIAVFETPLRSVMAYIHNLNTHPAYQELRARRAEMRTRGERPSGWDLAETLVRYSERGEAYVETLHSIMRANRLEPADDAYLGDGPSLYLVPVGAGAR
jgi:Bax protein